ncbi:MAG TPA: hypothetical protein VMM93_11240 [Vicinamibacterales bacterium]|nr:hypothetical protein [Vicinamibacterales bacterium]
MSWAAIAVGTAFVAGWIVGAAGRSSSEMAAGRAAEDVAFTTARTLVLEGRVALYQDNYGDARRAFDQAATTVTALQRRLRETGLGERAGLLEVALGYLRQAADQATSLDPGAQSAADAALQTLEVVRGATSESSR